MDCPSTSHAVIIATGIYSWLASSLFLRHKQLSAVFLLNDLSVLYILFPCLLILPGHGNAAFMWKSLFFSQNFSKTIYRFKAFEFMPFWMPTSANQSKNLKGPQVSTVAVPWNGGKPNTTSRKLHAIPFIHVASHSHMVVWKQRKCKVSISLWVPAMQRVSINIWPVWKIQHQLCWQL